MKDLLNVGFVRSLKTPYRASVLFQRKSNGSLLLCIDYKALDKVTVKNKYFILLVVDHFDQLGGAKYFTKLDLRSRYYQVRIAEGNEEMTTCVTRYGTYKFLVMSFGLTNALATFCTLMKKLFHPYLDLFVVVYLDDIIVYSNTSEEHVEYLRTIFQMLWKNQLFVKGGGALPWPLDRSGPIAHGPPKSVDDLAVGGAHDGARANILVTPRRRNCDPSSPTNPPPIREASYRRSD